MPLITTVLTVKGETRKANLPLESDGTLTLETLQKYMRKKEAPAPIGTLMSGLGLQLTAFAYTKGKAGTQNQSELPPGFSKQPLFGDILLIAFKKGSTWATPEPYTPETWTDETWDEEGEEEEEEEKADEEEEEEKAEEEEEDAEEELEEELEVSRAIVHP